MMQVLFGCFSGDTKLLFEMFYEKAYRVSQKENRKIQNVANYLLWPVGKLVYFLAQHVTNNCVANGVTAAGQTYSNAVTETTTRRRSRRCRNNQSKNMSRTNRRSYEFLLH